MITIILLFTCVVLGTMLGDFMYDLIKFTINKSRKGNLFLCWTQQEKWITLIKL